MSRHRLPVLPLLPTLVILLTAAPASAAPPLSAIDVFGLEWVSEPQIDPSGQRLVYVRNGMDIMTDQRQKRLWQVRADGAGHRPLTGREANESSPRWSPDGTRIAFTSTTDQGAEIFVYWLDGDRLSRISQLERSPDGLAWSPDGKWLAFSMLVPEKPPTLVEAPPKPKDAEWAEAPRVTTRLRHEADGSGHLEPGYEHYFVLPADGGTPRQVTQGDFQHNGEPQWTPDGSALVFAANRNPDHETKFRNTEVYRVSIADGATVALTARDGPDLQPVVSPDGQHIAFVGYADKVQTYQVATLQVMNADGSNQRVLTAELDRSVSSPVWRADSDGVYFRYDDAGTTRIGFVSLDGKLREVVSDVGGESIGRPYPSGSFSVARSGALAYTRTTSQRPAELALLPRTGRDVRTVVALNEDLLGQRALGEVEEIWYASSFDQRKLQGWIVLPPDFDASRRYPLLVENHGGPILNYGPRFSTEMQLYAAAGYVVFYPNPRGSTSYGEEFGNLLYHNYPGEDYQDVMDGVDAVIATGYVDPQQLFVTGGSAGGIMTAWIIGKNQRFRAAVVAKPVMNWFSKTLTADNYFQYADYRLPGQPWENIEAYMKFSPITLVGNVQTPTLVMVGTADLRTPLSEAKQLYHALKLRGVDTALVELPDASHSIARRPSQLIAKVAHILAWFERYRTADPSDASGEADAGADQAVQEAAGADR